MGLSKRQQQIKVMLEDSIRTMERYSEINFGELEEYYSVYLGSYMSLDPCGRYHHAISPNGVKENCIQYWESLEKVANLLGGWIQSGEGDPTDIYFCMTVSAYEKYAKRKMKGGKSNETAKI